MEPEVFSEQMHTCVSSYLHCRKQDKCDELVFLLRWEAHINSYENQLLYYTVSTSEWISSKCYPYNTPPPDNCPTTRTNYLSIYQIWWCQPSQPALSTSVRILSSVLDGPLLVMDNPCPPNMPPLFAPTLGLSKAQKRTQWEDHLLQARISWKGNQGFHKINLSSFSAKTNKNIGNMLLDFTWRILRKDQSSFQLPLDRAMEYAP